MFKPQQTLLFFTIILLVFIAISILPLPNVIKINSKYSIKIPKITINNHNKTNTKVEEILKKIDKSEDSVATNNKSNNTNITDSLYPINVPINFSSALHSFFYALENENYIHVLHYGDSQIEGDRITSYLRHKFQSIKGGNCPGLIIPYKVNNIKQAINVELKGNWKRFAIFGKANKAKHNQYGPLLQFIRFAPEYNDSIPNDSIIYDGNIILNNNSSLFNINKLQLIYGNLKKPVLVQLYVNKEFIEMKSLIPTLTTQTITFEINKTVNEIIIEFTGKDSPDLYAINFDSNQGIYFDNIPMRGSSGTDFSKILCSQLSSIFKQLNTKLIIYQFGINVVPSNLESYNFYEQWVYHQLKYLKQCSNDASILVVGTSDISFRTDSGIYSYPSVVKVRNAQKRAAERAGCAFWDTYEAMGGANSMQIWVKKGLASKDFTNFNYSGAQKISQLLYQAIYNEYINYRNANKNSTALKK